MRGLGIRLLAGVLAVAAGVMTPRLLSFIEDHPARRAAVSSLPFGMAFFGGLLLFLVILLLSKLAPSTPGRGERLPPFSLFMVIIAGSATGFLGLRILQLRSHSPFGFGVFAFVIPLFALCALLLVGALVARLSRRRSG